MIRDRRTRIVATLGPASAAPDRIRALAQAGVDVFRLNFSHGAKADHATALAAVRAAEAEVGRPLAALADLQGPKFRIGAFASGEVRLSVGQALRLDGDPAPGDGRRVALPHPEMLRVLTPGARILLDDGKVRLRVTARDGEAVETSVEAGDRLSDHKGAAVPGVAIPTSALTDKDRSDLEFALRAGVDWVALSFVQRAADMAELRRLVAGRAAVLAKIEKPAALGELEAICDLSDALMVARGDLGVELDPPEVPVAQKTIIRAARARGLPVIVATQMLDSMTHAPAPTRAEASDVANGVYEGADALMLSGETAAGDYPLETVAMMDAIIRRVEADPNWPRMMRAEYEGDGEDVDTLIAAATRAAEARSTACLVAWTNTGVTVRRLARERPAHPIIALAPDLTSARRLALVWGLEPRVMAQPDDPDALATTAARLATDLGFARPGERIVVIFGPPRGRPGAADTLRLMHAPQIG
ncbi:MAG: pyruvate kinase [Alphaproteobacteria bacterium]|nr:pyruvate kinase [Alphaproteobacteria bacterium]